MDLDLQALIDTGDAWRLEGAVGRAAMDAIEAGVCTLGPVGHRDFWGNYVPAVHEVEPGTKGSVEYARNLRPDLHAEDLPDEDVDPEPERHDPEVLDPKPALSEHLAGLAF